ncbi:MAG: S-adenosylmethionine:tRNA ribosyltransferase-isomerase [Bacteriovoracaceae bacterium]|jgi:S-adenosylmethionine:tRNA ribosyltransferase-isomerase
MTYNEEDSKLSSYDYELPEELVAERPVPDRASSRLLIYNEETDSVDHAQFTKIIEELPKGSTLVLNRSKVYPCRLFGKKETGAKVEVFILSLDSVDGAYPVLLKSSSKKRVGDKILFEKGLSCTISKVLEGTFEVKFSGYSAREVVEQIGVVPLPPYIRGGLSDELDKSTYQTVYAKELGSVAAPTAGLHFTPELIESLKEKEIQVAYVTLHVGLGTFLPVKTEEIGEHKMHSEKYFVDSENLELIKKAKKLICVGTTSLRVLESMPEDLAADQVYETDIFLHPGKKVRSIDGMITNFHLPKSSLIMLVSALVGREKTLELYKEAIDLRYRFFSYGDAMLIKRKGRWS